MRYDAIVLGLGGIGSAVAAHAAARGMHVLGIERFGPAHAMGSSHGASRIIRQAYFEAPDYVPLLLRAYELWDALARRTQSDLRIETGALFVGAPDAPVVAGTLRSALRWGLPHHVYETADLRARFPAFRPRPGEIGVYEAVAGVVRPEAGVCAHLDAAAADGAELRFESTVRGWDATDRGVQVHLDGERIEAHSLALCAGAWLASTAPELALPLVVERNVQVWFRPSGTEAGDGARLPIWCLDRPGARMFYGVPDLGDGVKAAFHGSGLGAEPDHLDRTATPGEIEAVRTALADFVPPAAGAFVRAAPCMYVNTPDDHFVIGPHPQYRCVVLAGGFCGHGYKFAPVVGAIVAALLAGDDPGFALELFAPDRFAH